jgi:hypothetical protein
LFISILQRQTCTTFAYICRHFFFFLRLPLFPTASTQQSREEKSE